MSRTRLNLCLVVHLDLPAGAPDQLAERAWLQCYQPLIGAIHHTPEVRLALALGGEMLQDLQQRHPEGLQWIRTLVQREQVELVGLPLHHIVLTGVPERDATGQMLAHSRLLLKLFGLRPRGGWLPYGAWDPLLPRVFRAAQLQWSLLDERVLDRRRSTSPPTPGGLWYTERDGQRLGLLPIDGRALEMIPRAPVKTVLSHLSRRARAGAEHLVLAVEGNRFGLRPAGSPRRDQSWFSTLLAALGRAQPSVQTLLPSETLRSAPRLGRCYVRATASRALGVPWERHLVRYPEANRLHKRMLRVSARVHRLGQRIEQQAHDHRRPDPSALEQARRYLYRAQATQVYWHGPHAGLYDARDRGRAWRDLLRAERVALDAMRGHQRLDVEHVDLDADGREEIALRSPSVSLVIEPHIGGALSELSVYRPARNLVDPLTRRPERYHSELESGDEEPTVTDGRHLQSTSSRPAGPSVEALRELLVHDRVPRLACQERLLDPAQRVEDFARGRMLELCPGLASEPWQVVDASRRGADQLEAVLARDAGIRPPQASAPIQRLRFTKSYRLGREPRLRYRIEAVSRAPGALRALLATELSLSLRTGHPVELAGSRRAVDAPADLGPVEQLRLYGAELSLEIEASAGARAWVFPLRSVHRHEQQWVLGDQGLALVILWPVELWEQEKSRVTLDITVRP